MCDLKPLEAFLNNKRTDPLRAEFHVRLRVHEDYIGDRTIRDENFAAVKQVTVARPFGSRAHAADRIGSGSGLRHAKRANPLARAELRKVLLLLHFVRVAIDVVDAKIVVREITQSDGRTVAREGLIDESRTEQVEVRAAVLIGHRRTKESILAKLREEVLGPPLLAIHLLRYGQELLAAESVRLIENHALVFRKIVSAGLRFELGHSSPRVNVSDYVNAP